MKDPKDKSTADLVSRLASRNRLKAYAVRQQAIGRRQRTIWMSDEEFAAAKELLKTMRGGADDEQA